MDPHQQVGLVRRVGLATDRIDRALVTVNGAQYLAGALSGLGIAVDDRDPILGGPCRAPGWIVVHVGGLVDHAHDPWVDHLHQHGGGDTNGAGRAGERPPGDDLRAKQAATDLA
jgi:hypothetical protein